MKRNIFALLFVMIILSSAFIIYKSGIHCDIIPEAVYLGVCGNETEKDRLVHRFFMDGREQVFKVSTKNNYSIQNRLMEGYIYKIFVKKGIVINAELLDKDSSCIVTGTVDGIGNGIITVDGKNLTMPDGINIFEIITEAGGASVKEAEIVNGDTVKVTVNGSTAVTIYKSFVSEKYEPPVRCTPGLKTLKNFLSAALEPVGTGLYVYGGSWDWQDEKSSNQSMTIGIPGSWIDFFQSQDENYTYKNTSDSAHSYYPHRGWNRYYYAGADCSGYVGWVVYNLLNTENSEVQNNSGYVCSAEKMAQMFGNSGWGTWTHGIGDGFRVGDVFSMSDHVWICIGICEDTSVVFLHSTPSESENGAPGGGIQISALNPANTKDCEAYRLADYYMSKYYPQWSERYDVIVPDYSLYTDAGSDFAGKFSWCLDGNGILTDPDDYENKTPSEILRDLFGENV